MRNSKIITNYGNGIFDSISIIFISVTKVVKAV